MKVVVIEVQHIARQRGQRRFALCRASPLSPKHPALVLHAGGDANRLVQKDLVETAMGEYPLDPRSFSGFPDDRVRTRATAGPPTSVSFHSSSASALGLLMMP